MEVVKKHRYLVGYVYEFKSGAFGIGSYTMTQDELGEKTTQQDLEWLAEEMKKKAQQKQDGHISKAFITSISYLGHTTDDEFNSKPT